MGLIGCAQDPKEKADVVIWHWMTDRKEAFGELAKKYQEQTDQKVEFKLFAPSGVYSQKIQAATQANALPDIFGVLGEKESFGIFIKSGYVLNLKSYMRADKRRWQNKFFPQAILVNEFKRRNEFGVEPGIYGVPIDVSNIQMLYNKDLFVEAGLNPDSPPVTFDEFIEAAKKIKATGKQGFVSGWAEVWMMNAMASNFAFNIMGQKKVMRTYEGKVPYTDPDWISVFTLFKQMADQEILAMGIIAMNNKDSEQNFANNRSGFTFNGSWCVNVYQAMNPDLNYGVMFMPKASDDYPMLIWGGAGSSLMVNAKSENKEKAVQFLQWLTDDEQQTYLSEKTNNLPANKNCLDNISPLLAEFAKSMKQTTHPNIWDVHEKSTVVEAFNIGLQLIVLGKKTPEEVAQDVQKVKERAMAKQR